MQRKNFLFEQSDLDQPNSTVLFKKWEFEKLKFSNSSTNLLSQFNLAHKLADNTNILSFYTTPPMDKKFAATPKAPMKQKKLPRKGDLKPKKLQYSDEEIDISSVEDSGVHFETVQSNDPLFHARNTAKYDRSDSSQRNTRRLRPVPDRINAQTNDKENDRNVVNYRSASAPNGKNNIAQKSSVVFNPNSETLSQCDDDLDWKETLYWLQPRRDIGLWIQCCRKNCRKWRYVDNYHDPTDVPTKWFCKMNSDKRIASCRIPEQPKSAAIESDLIEASYNAGSIVWARIDGFPWWPAIVNDCPETFKYYKLHKKSIKPVSYYVTFFDDEKLEYSWVHQRNLKPLAKNKYSQLIKKTKFRGIEYKESLKKAYEMASSALSLSILERLRKYSFVARYDKFYDTNNNANDSVDQTNELDEEIVENSEDERQWSDFRQHITLKEFYLKNKRTRSGKKLDYKSEFLS